MYVQMRRHDAEFQHNRAIGAGQGEESALGALREEVGFSSLSMWMNPGGQIPHERVLTSMRLFVERVAPRLS